MIQIPADSLKEAAKLLNRVRSARASLPVLSHVLATRNAAGVLLTATDLDTWLETRVSCAGPADGTDTMAIPAEAFAAAIKADKGTVVSFARKGPKDKRVVHLSARCGGLPVHTQHPACDASDFPERPAADGTATVIPARTVEMLGIVAPCASTDATRHILNGVLFTPEDGGKLVATDGKRLAVAPATVPGRRFVLPSAAVKLLGQAEFRKGPLTVTSSDDPEKGLVRFQCGDLALTARTIDGNYPAWQQVVPREMVASVSVPENRRAALVAWLRSLAGRNSSVTLRRGKRGVLVIDHASSTGTAATVEVPVESTGEPEPVSLDPVYLAGALEIAPVLWITDALTPVVARRGDGVFCVVMPRRPVEPVEAPVRKPAQPAPQPAQAAA